MTRQLRLGHAEKRVLHALIKEGGTWSTKDRSLWDNRYWTLSVLQSLAKKGMTEETAPDTFKVTAAGREADDKEAAFDVWLMPSTLPPSSPYNPAERFKR